MARNLFLAALPTMPRITKPPVRLRPPMPRRPTTTPTGPRLYRVTRKNTVTLGGPGIAPPGFVTQQQTASEWVWYWASMKVLDPLRDPRKPPFYGGQNWSYQKQVLPQTSHTYAKSLSTNIDFLYTLAYPALAVRIQTYRYHLATTSFKQAYDTAQLLRELGAFNVVDVYEQDFLSDATGAAAIIMVKQTLGLIATQNPLTGRTIQLTRNPIAVH